MEQSHVRKEVEGRGKRLQLNVVLHLKKRSRLKMADFAAAAVMQMNDLRRRRLDEEADQMRAAWEAARRQQQPFAQPPLAQHVEVPNIEVRLCGCRLWRAPS
jgi:hypothetical protein